MKTMYLGLGALALGAVAVATLSGPALRGNATPDVVPVNSAPLAAEKAADKTVLLSVAGMH